MKYHNFSEALRGSVAIQDDNDYIAIIVPESGNSTFLVSSITKTDNVVTIAAYSAKFMRVRNMSVIPVTYKTLKEFENSKINNPQSFIPLGSTFDKDLPDVQIYLDSNKIEGDYRCLSTNFMDSSSKHIIPVMIYQSAANPSNIDTIVDYEIASMEGQLKYIVDENQPDEEINNDNYASGVKKDEELTRVEVVMYDLKTMGKTPTRFENCYMDIVTETYRVKECEFGEGVLGLVFPDGKMKAIPVNRIKEVNIEKKKEI